MRVTLGELAPATGQVERNLDRIEAAVRASPGGLAIFPELFLTGYQLGDRFHGLALSGSAEDPVAQRLCRIAKATATPLAVGAPTASADRAGELENVALLIDPAGRISRQSKRYLPNFGPFEEALAFSPTSESRPLEVDGHRVGFEICYDAFFPEVARDLALAGAEMLVNISASPVTSRRLFERVLPARAIENGLPVVYVNRVGVEDGLVFAGGSGAWDLRGEPIPPTEVAMPGLAPEEHLFSVEVDLGSVVRGRAFRPVLRDVATRPRPPAAGAGDQRSGRGDRL